MKEFYFVQLKDLYFVHQTYWIFFRMESGRRVVNRAVSSANIPFVQIVKLIKRNMLYKRLENIVCKMGSISIVFYASSRDSIYSQR